MTVSLALLRHNRKAAISFQDQEEFRRIFSRWQDQNAEALEAGGMGDLDCLSQIVLKWATGIIAKQDGEVKSVY